MTEFEKVIDINKRAIDTLPDGRISTNVRYLFKGSAGVTHFVMWLTEYSEETTDNLLAIEDTLLPEAFMEKFGHSGEHRVTAMAVDLGYHSPVCMSEYNLEARECDVIPGGSCFGDGSGLSAEPIMRAFFISKEDELIWRELEQYYRELFEGETGL